MLDFAEQKNTPVYEFELPQNSSVSTKVGGGCFIGIDRQKLTCPSDLAVHLAHELGHCETDAFYCIYSPLVSRDKLERKANVWAIEHLIPEKRLKKALSLGICEEWELAEHFGVTRAFVRAAVQYYRTGEVCLCIR